MNQSSIIQVHLRYNNWRRGLWINKFYDGNCSPRNSQLIQPNGRTYHLLPGTCPTFLRCKFSWRWQTSAHLSQHRWFCHALMQFYEIYLLLHFQVLSHGLTFSNASRSITSPRELPLWSATTFTKEINSKEKLQPSTMQLFATRNTLSIRWLPRGSPSRSVCLRPTWRSRSTTIALREGTLTAMDLAVSMEAAEKNTRFVKGHDSSIKKIKEQYQPRSHSTSCTAILLQMWEDQPCKDAIYHACGKKGHIAPVCRSMQIRKECNNAANELIWSTKFLWLEIWGILYV